MDGEVKIDSRVSELVLSRLALFNKLNLIVRERQDLSSRWEGLDPLTSREAILYLMNFIPHDEVDELVLRRYANYISTDDRLVVDSEKMTAFNLKICKVHSEETKTIADMQTRLRKMIDQWL